MRSCLLLLAVGLASADAQGVVRLFFTSSAQPYGLTDPSLAFLPTRGSHDDSAFYQVGAFPPLEAWGQTPTINWHAGEFAYVWVRFHQEPTNKKVRGVHLDHDGNPLEVAYYVVDDLEGSSGGKRWDGAYTPPEAPEFKCDPQILAAVTTHGIVNRATDVDAWNLYDHETRTALLGAVRFGSDGLRGAAIQSGPPSPIPPPQPPPWFLVWEVGQANWVPEPTAFGLMLLLYAAGGRSRRTRLAE